MRNFSSAGSQKKQILVVDDEPGITLMMKFGLESFGPFDVHEENISAKAIDTARDIRPDVIILDLMMPDPDGHELAARLKQDPELGHIPVIFLTALIHTTTTCEGPSDAVRRYYLAKPVDLSELVRYIERCSPPTRHIREGLILGMA